MKPIYYIAAAVTLLFYACKKKVEPIAFSGQLLFTNKYPRPIANRKIEVYQAGASAAIGINSGSTSSSATTNTDVNGNFQLIFTPGTSSFLFFSGTNSNSLTLENALSYTAFPTFSRKNFPDSAYDASKPIIIGKTIDTVIIKVGLASNLTQSDTLGLQANTISGRISKEYTRRTGNVGGTIVLDTIYNMLFTDFDCYQKTFNNNVYAGRKYTTTFGYTSISSSGFISPAQFSAIDEVKREITFYFEK